MPFGSGGGLHCTTALLDVISVTDGCGTGPGTIGIHNLM